MKNTSSLFSRLGEVFRFAFSGGVCFLVEFAALVLCKEKLGFSVMLATAAAFAVSVLLNYIMCILWVFRGAKNHSHKAKITFAVTSLVGFLLNQLFMWALCRLFGEDTVLFTLFGKDVNQYMLNKVITTLLVMIWNYFTKRSALKRGQGAAE